MKRLPLLSTTMASPKEWLWAMWTVKFFACFIVSIKWPTHPTFPGVNTTPLHLFKAHLSNHQCWYSFVKKQWLFATHEAEFFFMNRLKYFETNSYPSWLERLTAKSSAQHFYHSPCYFYDLGFVRLTSCNTAIGIPELGPKSITQHKKYVVWKWGLYKRLHRNVFCVLYLTALSVTRIIQRQQPTNKCRFCIAGSHTTQSWALRNFNFTYTFCMVTKGGLLHWGRNANCLKKLQVRLWTSRVLSIGAIYSAGIGRNFAFINILRLKQEGVCRELEASKNYHAVGIGRISVIHPLLLFLHTFSHGFTTRQSSSFVQVFRSLFGTTDILL
jgi:hypothetical protein